MAESDNQMRGRLDVQGQHIAHLMEHGHEQQGFRFATGGAPGAGHVHAGTTSIGRRCRLRLKGHTTGFISTAQAGIASVVGRLLDDDDGEAPLLSHGPHGPALRQALHDVHSAWAEPRLGSPEAAAYDEAWALPSWGSPEEDEPQDAWADAPLRPLPDEPLWTAPPVSSRWPEAEMWGAAAAGPPPTDAYAGPALWMGSLAVPPPPVAAVAKAVMLPKRAVAGRATGVVGAAGEPLVKRTAFAVPAAAARRRQMMAAAAAAVSPTIVSAAEETPGGVAVLRHCRPQVVKRARSQEAEAGHATADTVAGFRPGCEEAMPTTTPEAAAVAPIAAAAVAETSAAAAQTAPSTACLAQPGQDATALAAAVAAAAAAGTAATAQNTRPPKRQRTGMSGRAAAAATAAVMGGLVVACWLNGFE